MSEILQIFHQSPPSHHQMRTDVVNLDSLFNWSLDSDFSSPDIFTVTEHSQFLTSSVDELSKVTTIAEQNQSLKKRKLEFDIVEVNSQKQCVENSKPKADMKRDYIHVRARRGQATDSHSLAERARRERIKKKMQFLQDLVPGCNKMTNKAAILDEIITYVQCLQSDVEILTMKLAASTTSVDLTMDTYNNKSYA